MEMTGTYVPNGVATVVATVMVIVPPPVILGGLKLAVAPGGSSVTLGVTTPEKPLSANAVMM
jgi:hypothetical protein